MKYEIIGQTVPAVEISLASGESVYTQSGGMTWQTDGISMKTNARGGLKKTLGRMFSGESLFMVNYTAEKEGAKVAFAATMPGVILPVDLSGGKTLIAQNQNNIPLAHLGTLLGDNLLHNTTLKRRNLYGCHRLYLTAEADVVVEFAGSHIADSQSLFVDPERARIVTEDQPENECGHERSEPVGKCLAREREGDALLLFYRSVHRL